VLCDEVVMAATDLPTVKIRNYFVFWSEWTKILRKISMMPLREVNSE
jgi:hypothetical protein